MCVHGAKNSNEPKRMTMTGRESKLGVRMRQTCCGGGVLASKGLNIVKRTKQSVCLGAMQREMLLLLMLSVLLLLS